MCQGFLEWLDDNILNSISLWSTGPRGKPKRAIVHDNKDGTYAVTTSQDKTGRYMSRVTYGGDDIPLSPSASGPHRRVMPASAWPQVSTAQGLWHHKASACHLILVWSGQDAQRFSASVRLRRKAFLEGKHWSSRSCSKDQRLS